MRRFTLALCLALLMTLSACGQSAVDGEKFSSESVTPKDSNPEQSTTAAPNDRPIVPDDVPEGTEYQYDFQFSQRYDDRITEDFSLTLSDRNETLVLFEKYQNEQDAANEQSFSGDGMVPHIYKRYGYTTGQGELTIGTDYYEPENVEHISYIWTTIEGAKTNQNIAVGSTEKELLSAYANDVYYIEKDGVEPFFMALDENDTFGLEFDYAYAWQPFTQETNDIRDITFYLADGKVAAIELIDPYELRYVYGHDREAGLKYAQEQRSR